MNPSSAEPPGISVNRGSFAEKPQTYAKRSRSSASRILAVYVKSILCFRSASLRRVQYHFDIPLNLNICLKNIILLVII